MTGAIENYAPASGRVMREDSSVLNIAEIVQPLGGGNGTVTYADTDAHAMAANACKLVILQNSPSSGGYVKIGLTNTPSIELGPGQFAPPMYVTDLSKIYYQFTAASSNLNYLYQV